MMKARKSQAKRSSFAVFCLSAVMALAVGGPIFSAEEGLNFSVKVATPQAVILACEPLVLDAAVRNKGPIAAEFGQMHKYATGPLRFHVTGPDGRQWRYIPMERAQMEMRKVLLRPGEVYRYRLQLLCGGWKPTGRSSGYAFPEPGDYLVNVLFRHHGRDFEGAPLKVTVVQPSGRGQEALELFRGRNQADFVELGQREVPEEFRRLAAEYPDTVYGRYARYYLAATVLQHRFDWEEARRTFAAELAGLDPTAADHRLREEVYRKTASEFADLARSEPAFPLADQCLLYLAECYLKPYVNRRAEAVKVLQDLVAKYPVSPVAVKAKTRLEKLDKEPAPPTAGPSSP